MRKKHSGFTLLEIVLSLAIISVALLVIINCFSQAIYAKRSVLSYTQAMFLAQEKIFEIENDSLDMTAKQGRFAPPFEAFRWKIDQSKGISGGLAKIDLSIHWFVQGAAKNLTVSTIIDK